jgi:hydroxymethylglutaryl-CoA lyase
MGFGNPYGDEYTAEVAINWVKRLTEMGIRTIAMSDTVGVAKPESISYIFEKLVPEFPEVHIGAHFHSQVDNWQEKLDTAWKNGCTRFDSALKGIGGCPMAADELTGNIATENVIWWAEQNNIPLKLNKQAFNEAMLIASEIFI